VEEDLLAHSPDRDELLDALEEKLLSGSPEAGSIAAELERATARLSRRVEADPKNVEKGLAQLVLTLIELLRQLMERQAVRRIEAGSLTDDEIDRLGETFMKLEQRMDELKRQFDLRDEDLNLNLGPLGDLL
jgi:Gas vesicle protein K